MTALDQGSPYSQNLGIEILEARGDYGAARIEIHPCHTNRHGIAHGGLIFSLADTAFGAAENHLGEEGETWVSMEMNVRYLRPATTSQVLTAEARLVQRTRLTSFYRIDVTDDNGRLVAALSGTGHVLPQKPSQEKK